MILRLLCQITYARRACWSAIRFVSRLMSKGVGALVGNRRRKKVGEARPGLKLGICGEHGGDPDSIFFRGKG